MRTEILVKYGEIILKGQNRPFFERILINNIKNALPKAKISIHQAVIYIDPQEEANAKTALSKIFGITWYSESAVCDKNLQSIMETTAQYLGDTLSRAKTFKVVAKRADKTFGHNSQSINCLLGEYILKAFPHIKVCVKEPEVYVYVEVREGGCYVYSQRFEGRGGLPTGANGRGLLLLSGGIDSPVAGYMMAKRGLSIDCIHFESPPYTSQLALEKVITLKDKLQEYAGKINLIVVPFTEMQEKIRDKCKSGYMTVILRRQMMKKAEEIANERGIGAIITGESLGQVASQTLEALACTDVATQLPVLRPLIGMDKEEIIKIARNIGTYETSILPYEDCCTVFTPKHPNTKPRLSNVLQEEGKL